MDVHYTEARWTVDCNVLLMHFNFSAKNNYLGQEFGLHVYLVSNPKYENRNKDK